MTEQIRFTATIEIDMFDGITPALKVNGFWLSGQNGVSRALWRVGQVITAKTNPSDQFCYEVK